MDHIPKEGLWNKAKHPQASPPTPVKKKSFAIILLGFFHLLSSLLSVVGQPCNRAVFPKIIGGSAGNTNWRQIEYHIASDQLAGGGRLDDLGVKGGVTLTFSPMNPFIALFRGLYKELAWGKWFDLSYNFRGVAFSADGLIIVATTDNNGRLFVFRTADGFLINS